MCGEDLILFCFSLIAHPTPTPNHFNVCILHLSFGFFPWMFLQKHHALCADILNLHKLYCVLNLIFLFLFFHSGQGLKDPLCLKAILIVGVCVSPRGGCRNLAPRACPYSPM